MFSSAGLDCFEELVARIRRLLTEKDRIVVAISGFGGSGKSSLADSLADAFGIQAAQMIRIDHLYSRNPNGSGMLDQVNWPLLIHILEACCLGRRLQYTGRGFQGETLSVSEDLPNLVIVEGIRLLQPVLLPYFDISVWMDCPQELAIQRAKQRDRAQGENEEAIRRWDTDWGPKDQEYFNAYRPDQLATVLYETS